MAEGSWSATACWSADPINGKWLGISGQGCYWQSIWGTAWVTGRTYNMYMINHAECGWLGFPFTNKTAVAGQPGVFVQYFIRPGSYDLNFIIEWADGSTTAHVLPDYFARPF